MSTFSKAHCYFQTSDNPDGTFWIYVSAQDQPLKLDNREIGIGLHLKPDMPMKEADDFAGLLNKYVTHVQVQYE